MDTEGKFLVGVYAAAFLAVAAISVHKPDTNGPTLTQEFQCSQATGEHPYRTRQATLVNVPDNKTGASHFELQLATLADSAHGSNSPHVRDGGTVDYPQGSGPAGGVTQAVAYCVHETLPAHLAPRQTL